jgi:hypothetical protein
MAVLPAEAAPARKPAARAASPAPRLSGYWRLVDRKSPAPPALTAWARAEMAKTKTDGEVDVEASRWCVPQGLPYLMTSAGALEFRTAPTEILMLAERLGIPRHIYTARRTHVSEDVFDHTPLGNSIGRWTGGVLTVDTVGFNKGVGPTGAPRTETAHLVERFQVSGDRLVVTSTWTDPKAFSRPYTYTLTYERLPAAYVGQENYCDPRDNGVGHKL